MVGLVLLALAVLLLTILVQGLPHLDRQFLTSFPSRFVAKAGVKAALFGTLWLMMLTAALAILLGVAAAVYLEEYARPGRLNAAIEVNIANLAGVPSIVYGMLGLALFVRGLGCGRSLVAGGLTLGILVLPMVIIASREALRAVPSSLRQAAYALGATRWQAVRCHVLPTALPGIATSVILALSRAIGETAPLVMMGALTYVAFVPHRLTDAFTALPIQVFNWASRPQREFHALAASGIIVLLVVLLSMNGLAIGLRNRAERRVRW
ncbi:MAG: phosphate ABC transporter permease PstA [Armatimonadetes bacterium]|nr:phosphate ABC transporter permease PstA [Armatimonadota bacterium]